MPISSRSCPVAGQHSESPEFRYRTETSFKNFSGFLNQPLAVVSRNPAVLAHFSLLDLLKYLDIQQGLLKGSTVHSWKSKKPPEDIDLQFCMNNEINTDQLTGKILDFLNARSSCSANQNQALKDKVWFSKVAHQMSGAWNRLIICMGYPRGNHTTLDLNFTNSQAVSYDTILASKAIGFNWTQRKAALIDSWHPSLVKWLQDHQLLWFKPDIEEGLGRLSYRLTRLSPAYLLQPQVTAHFYDQASHPAVCNIYMRILMNEYPGSQLSIEERGQLWQAIVQSAKKNEHTGVYRDLLGWTKLDTLDQLQFELSQTDTRTKVLNRLTQGCKVGADFNTSVKNLLLDDEELTTSLKPLIAKALGATLVPGELLFSMLDSWDQIQEVPDNELQAVFEEYLNVLSANDNPLTSCRAQNMLGWLAGNDSLSSLKFWMDRIPEQLNIEPSEKSIETVIDAALDVIKNHGPEGLAPIISRFSKLKISQESCHELCRSLLQSNHSERELVDESSRHPALEFMQILVRHSLVFSSMVPGNHVQFPEDGKLLPTQQLHAELLGWATRLQSADIPPMLQPIVKLKSDMVEIELPELMLSVSINQATILGHVGKNRHWMTEHAYGVMKPRQQNELSLVHFIWQDGSFLVAQPVAPNNSNFKGELSYLGSLQDHPGVTGLLQAGRRLCASQFPALCFEQNCLTAEGVFNGPQLLKASTFVEVMQTLKQGMIRDESKIPNLWIEHHIKDHLPTDCKVMIQGKNHHTRLHLRYGKSNSEIASSPEFDNAWGVRPIAEAIRSECGVNIPPFGMVEMLASMPWNLDQRPLPGWAEVKSSGPLNFKWQGRVQAGELLPFGSLYLDRQKVPVLVFNAEDSPANIPLSLLPVMADLLGKRLNGQYPFSPRVWNEPASWPPNGFEGFINHHPCGDHYFSGYLTSTGQAVGILSQSADPQKDYYQAWCGNFSVQPASAMARKPIGLDSQSKQLFGVPLSDSDILMPHGLTCELILGRDDHISHATIGRIYFAGEGIAYKQLTQSSELVYDSPNMKRYLVGSGYSLNKQRMHLDVVFNAGDGGNDFMIIRPINFDSANNYQEIYCDDQGTRANWLVVNQEYRMGQIHFPSGLEYSGQIAKQGNFFGLSGKGKITLGSLSFTAEFDTEYGVSKLKPLNEQSQHWLDSYTPPGKNSDFKLSEWVELISAGEINWETDVKANLLVRKLGSLKSIATVFSAS